MGDYTEYYDFLVLMKGNKKAGIILKMGIYDIHIYTFHKYRNHHIMSRLTGNGFLSRFWSDVKGVSCTTDEFDKVSHIAQNMGFVCHNNTSYYFE